MSSLQEVAGMADIAQVLLDEIRTYENTPDLGVEVTKGKGLFNRRKVIHVFGAVSTELVKQKIGEITQKHAGEAFDVSNEVRVKAR
jgi:hypothetical protein